MHGADSSGALAAAAVAAATAALGCLPVVRACLAQTSVIGQPTCDELVALLNDTMIGCPHLESAFGLNCTGCECSTVAAVTENPADRAQLQGALWTLAAAAFMIVGVVVATFTHKVRSREVVLPENERRPLSEEEMAKVRRAQLRMKTRRFSRTMNSLSAAVLPQRAIIQASNDAINASLKKPVTTAFLNFSAARMAAQRLKHSVSQRTGAGGGGAAAAAAGNSEHDGVYTVGSLSDLGQLDSNNTPGATMRSRTPPVDGPAGAAAGSEEEHKVRDPAGGHKAAREGPKVGGGASDSAVRISAPPSVSRQGTVLVAAATAAGNGGVARAVSYGGGVAAVVPRAGPTAREREAKMSPPPEAKTTTPEGKTAATGTRGSSREAKTAGAPPHISEGEGVRSAPPPLSSMLSSRPGTGNSKSGRRSSMNSSTAQLSPGGDSVGGRSMSSTPGNGKTVTPEPRASDGGGGGSRASPDRQHSLGLYNQASSPEGAALNPLSVHAAAAAAAAGGSSAGTSGLSASATLRGQVPVQRLGSGGSTGGVQRLASDGTGGGVQRLSSDGVLNRIATAYNLEAPPVRRIDSSHFGTGSPTFKQQR